MSYVDMLKELVAKKNEKQNKGKKKTDSGVDKNLSKDQVISHKPAKKSAGRGR